MASTETSMAPSTFHPFRALPQELKDMIWDAAIEALPRDDCYRFDAFDTFDPRLVSDQASGFIVYPYPCKDTLTATRPHRFLITACSDARKRMMHSFGAPLTLSIPTKLDEHECPISFQQFSMPIDFSRASVCLDGLFIARLYFHIERYIQLKPLWMHFPLDASELGAQDPRRPATLPRAYAVQLDEVQAPGDRPMRFVKLISFDEPKHVDLRDGKRVSDVWDSDMPGFAALFTTTFQRSGGLVDIVSFRDNCITVKLPVTTTSDFFRPWILPSTRSLGRRPGYWYWHCT